MSQGASSYSLVMGGWRSKGLGESHFATIKMCSSTMSFLVAVTSPLRLKPIFGGDFALLTPRYMAMRPVRFRVFPLSIVSSSDLYSRVLEMCARRCIKAHLSVPAHDESFEEHELLICNMMVCPHSVIWLLKLKVSYCIWIPNCPRKHVQWEN